MTSFINDEGSEILVSEDVSLTKQVATFKNFNIKGDVSISLKISNDSKNRQSLGYYGFNQLDSPMLSQAMFNMVKNGNVLSRGFVVIESVDSYYITIYFISGNANWFSYFKFNCREIVNSDLQVQANWTSVYESMGLNSLGAVTSDPREYGIVFPFIDIWSKGQRFDSRYFGGVWKSDTGNSEYILTDVYPALYVKTLVNELSKVAGIKISGSILNDKIYNSLIITPEEADLIDPDNEEVISMIGLGSTFTAPYIKVGMLAPDMMAIDFIKWLSISFGCVPVYDTYSRTLELNILDKFDKADAEDWSDYLKSYTIYNDVSKNNYIRLPEAPEESFNIYNSTRTVKYGELNIESEKTDESAKTVYTSPFPPVKDFEFDSTNSMKWATPYVPIFELEDSEEYDYTSVTLGTNGTTRFTGTGLPFNTLSDFIVFRIVDDAGIYDGYHTSYSTDAPSATGINSQCDFVSNSSGKIYTQKISKGSPGARVIVFLDRVGVDEITQEINFLIRRGNGFTTINAAYYSKEESIYPLMNEHKQNLSYGSIDGGYGIPLADFYLKNISNAIRNPKIVSTMILTDAVFQKFNFGSFIYLSKGDVNGYFMVEKIDNYINGVLPVRVDLVKMD